MKNGKTKGGRSLFPAFIAFILACSLWLAGLVYAALKDTTAVVDNELVPATVTCQVNETFNGQTKTNVSVTNTGNVPAFIRVKVVLNWTDSDGYPAWFAGSSDYGVSTTLASPLNWTNAKGSSVIDDGYWYYNGIVQPNGATSDLIASIAENLSAAVSANPQYHLKVTVLAEAIQAASTAASESWGMTFNGSAWSAVPTSATTTTATTTTTTP